MQIILFFNIARSTQTVGQLAEVQFRVARSQVSLHPCYFGGTWILILLRTNQTLMQILKRNSIWTLSVFIIFTDILMQTGKKFCCEAVNIFTLNWACSQWYSQFLNPIVKSKALNKPATCKSLDHQVGLTQFLLPYSAALLVNSKI